MDKNITVVFYFVYCGVLSHMSCYDADEKTIGNIDVINYFRVNYKEYISCTCGFPFGCLCSHFRKCTITAKEFGKIKQEIKKKPS